MEKKKSPPLRALKLKLFYSLPKAMSSKPSSKKKKKKTADVSIIPRRASTRVKNKGSFSFQGPRSPTVSCIGYVANKGNKKNQKKEEKKRKDDRKGKEHSNLVAASRSNPSLILKLLKVFKNKGAKTANPYAESSYSPPGAVYEKSVPKLGYAKKLSGCRQGVLSGFNWRVHDLSVLGTDRPTSLSNKREEKRKGGEVVEVIVLVPRKEINLWKKRMVAPPPPLLV